MIYYGDFAFRVISYVLGLFIVPVITFFLVAVPLCAIGFEVISLIMWITSSVALYIFHVVMTKIKFPN